MSLDIDIDDLGIEELEALNERIVARLKFLDTLRAQQTMMQLNLGAQVSFEQVVAVHSSLGGATVMLLALGVAPGVAYLVAAVGISRGRPAARFVAMTLLATQVLVLSGLLLFQSVNAITAASPPALTLNVLALGTPIAALLFALRCLWRMRI